MRAIDGDDIQSVTTGALAKYRAEVSSASEGAVTIPDPWD
jgi:hypothetical protein